MPLQMNYTSPDGVNYPQAYLYSPVIVFTPEVATISLNWYANKQEWENSLVPIHQSGHSMDTSTYPSANVFGAAYAHLLTLPEFSTAIEVP